MKEPRYHKYHRVFCKQKHCNGTVLRNKWVEGDRGADFIYQVVTDKAEVFWVSHWNLSSADEIEFFIGSHIYHVELKTYRLVTDIQGYNSTNGGWMYKIKLVNNGEEIIAYRRDLLTKRRGEQIEAASTVS